MTPDERVRLLALVERWRVQLIKIRNDIMAAIVTMRGGHVAIQDSSDEAMAALDIALGTMFAELAALLPPVGPPPANPLQAELLDLLNLMPDSQVDEILSFVATLREARGK